jgi:hypothetical protein
MTESHCIQPFLSVSSTDLRNTQSQLPALVVTSPPGDDDAAHLAIW